MAKAITRNSKRLMYPANGLPASAEEQAGRYLDVGPAMWDDALYGPPEENPDDWDEDDDRCWEDYKG